MTFLKNKISYLKRKGKLTVSKLFKNQLYLIEKRRISFILKNNNKLILVYTIGKVGSSSVHHSLKESKELNSPIFHIHSLNPQRIEEQKEYYLNSVRGSIPFHLIQSTVLSELLPSFKGKIYIFTLIREPIQREISSIFQDSFNFTMSSQVADAGIGDVVQKKMERLFQDLPENEWFERELKQVFGFDVITDDFEFSVSKNYTIANQGKNRLALVRLENLNQVFSEVCQQLFNKEVEFKLLQTNLSDDKFYKRDYSEIKEEITFSKTKIARTLSSKFIQKFYPDYIPHIRTKFMSFNKSL